MNSIDIKNQVAQAFENSVRPVHFTDYKHCEECADHDETLRLHDRDTIGLEQLGNPGWDPICFVLPQAFAYYFPALVRLALESEGPNSYLEQFLFHVTYEGERSRFFKHFSKAQRQATLDVLRYMRANMADAIAAWNLGSELEEAIALWSTLTADT